MPDRPSIGAQEPVRLEHSMRVDAEKQDAPPDLPSMGLQEALVALLRLQSVDLDTDRLIAGLPIVDGVLSEDLMDRATHRLGYEIVWQTARSVKYLDFPCCVPLKTGGYIVAVGLDQGNLQVLDTSSRAAHRSIPLQKLQKAYTKRSFQTLPSNELLLERHATGAFKRHWFWGRLFLEKRRLWDIVLSSMFANILAVTTALFVLQVYDRVIPAQSEATLWVLTSGVLLAVLFEAVLRIARARLIDQMGKEAEIEISSDLFTRVLGMKLDRRPSSPGGIVHMVREFSSVKEFFTTAAVGVVADFPFMFVFLGLIYGIAGNVVWVIVLGAFLIVLPSLLLQRRMARLAEETMGGMGAASRLLTESAYGLETIKTTRSESMFQNQWEEIIALNALKTTEQRGLGAFLTYWSTAMQQGTYIFAVLTGVYLIFAGDVTTGVIFAVAILTSRTLSPVTQFSQVLSRWQTMRTSVKALDDIMAAEQERDPERTYVRRPRLGGHVAFQKVKFSHPGTQAVTINIERFNVQPGQRIALMGVNGSGKSTLLRLAAGLYQPTDGEILIDGLDIRQMDPNDLRRNIGYLPQEVRMFRGSLRDNLSSIGQKYDDDRLLEALAFGGLGDFVRHHPAGLDLQIIDGGDGLSIGQRQSIGLARLYLQDPSVILLDEPTAALDQNLENTIVSRIGSWIGTRSCIVATHRPQILSQMSHVAVLVQGQVFMEGERDVVLKKLMTKPPAPTVVGST